MTRNIQLWGWEKDILRQLLYLSPDGQSAAISLSDAAITSGHPHIHPEKLAGMAKKFAVLGYGQFEIRETQVPSTDVDFRLSRIGMDAATDLAKSLEYTSPVERIARLNWSTIAAIVSAFAAVVSAIFAYQVGR